MRENFLLDWSYLNTEQPRTLRNDRKHLLEGHALDIIPFDHI